jgi:thioredoxin-related protein
MNMVVGRIGWHGFVRVAMSCVLRMLTRTRAWHTEAALALLVTTAACTAQPPASTPLAPTPAVLFRHESVAKAWETARDQRRPLVVMFTSDRCPHCERMLAETYAHPEIGAFLAAHAETALAHAKDNRELAARLGIRGYPTTIVVSPEGQIVDAVEGFVDAAEFGKRISRWMGPQAQASAQVTSVSAAPKS